VTTWKGVTMDMSAILKGGTLIALILSIAPSAVAQHRGNHGVGVYGGSYASPVYGTYRAPMVSYSYPRAYASGTRDTSSDRLSYVPSQVQQMGVTDIQSRATVLANLYRSEAISSQQYQETWNRIASER
jgi:hypothetical protein